MLQIKNLTKSYWVKKLFDNFSISGFDKEDKIWIIWENGRWKSTLLKMIYWTIKADFWEIKFDIKEPLIGYMSQEMNSILEEWIQKEVTILEYIKYNSWYEEIERKIMKIYNNYDEKSVKELWILQEKFEKLWWYNFDYKIETILFSLTWWEINKNDKIWFLSGGQQSKVLLALALLKWWDVLLLDEPTNNLDQKSIEWLVEFLEDSSVFALIVSHDKYFLNQVTNKTLELGKNEVKLYGWNYNFYEIQKELEQNKNNENYNEFTEKFKQLKEKLDKEYSRKSGLKKVKENPWLPRIVMWKYKDNAQISSGKEIKRLKKEMEILARNKPEIEKKKTLNFDLSLLGKVYGWIFVKDLEFSYKNNVNDRQKHLNIFVRSFEIQNWEKVLITWNNGSGKTTFLKLLIWELKAQKWEIKISPNIKIWNYSQEKKFLDNCNLSLIEFLTSQFGEENKEEFVHNIIKKFNFTEKEKNSLVSILSPWQKNRLLLALFSLTKYNTLILDEPTNHLDLEAIEELEKTLKDFNGNLIIVSHDKQFIENISFNKRYNMENWILKEFI
jgi:ATP-binding cassette subfamily F protein 3